MIKMIAVRAYIDRNDKSVRTFILKGILLEHIQKHGLGSSISGAPLTEQSEAVKAMIHTIKRTFLGDKEEEYLMKNTPCQCVLLAKSLHEERDGAGATVTQLPDILKPNSQLMRLKAKAVQHLRNGRNKKALEMYQQAYTLLEPELLRTESGDEALGKLGNEAGKLKCNMSLVCMNMNNPQQALTYAEEAASLFPGWSKPHCRRALALEALENYEKAEFAISAAIDAVEHELAEDPHAGQVKMEYLEIQQRVQEKLPDVAPEDDMAIDWERDEQARRKALISPISDDPFHNQVEEPLHKYVNEKLGDSAAALHSLLTQISVFEAPMQTGIPSWLKAMLSQAPTPMRIKIEDHYVTSGPLWLRREMQELAFARVEAYVNSVDAFVDRDKIRSVYQRDVDGDAMRLLCWTGFDTYDGELEDIDAVAFVLLLNLIVV
ncbi:MAG: hypothetical protein SGARI_000752, partial [Bacillariaceae sp.]